MKKFVLIINIVILMCALLVLISCKSADIKDEETFKIVTSFYPIYIATLNIAEGAENVTVENMTSNQVGCLHEYTLKTDDMLKVENADVFIQNGKGLEGFIDKLKKVYSEVKFVDSSEGIETENAHIWVNIDMYKKQVENIAKNLGELNQKNKNIYEKNASEYIDKLNSEVASMNVEENIDAITFNETLENLSDKIKLTVIETAHEETALSANQLAEVIDKMKNENIKVILVDKNESYRNAESLKNETDATIYEIDSYTKGDNDKDSYLKALRENIKILNSIER